MCDAYRIRLAEPADIRRLPEIERRAVQLFERWLKETGLTREVLYDVTSMEELEEARLRGQLWVTVLQTGEPVGFAHVIILDGLVHLDELDVVPEHGSRGIGSRLLDTVCSWARSGRYRKVTLSTFRDVPFNRPFYERRGFRVVDGSALPPQHVSLVDSERARGLRTDVRVIMEYPLELSESE